MRPQTQAILSPERAPWVAGGGTIGLLILDDRRCGAFSSEIARLIGAISSLIAVALLQAESSRILQEKAARLVEEGNRLIGLDSDAFPSLLAKLFAGKPRSRPGWEALRFGAAALEAHGRRPWPGNVRELRNVVEGAAILARGGEVGPGELTAEEGRDATSEASSPAASGLPCSSLDEAPRAHIA